MKKAIVTLAVGERYIKMFDTLCRNNWEIYTKKFNYDLIVVTEPLDLSDRAKSRSVSWQKLLILSQEWSSNYDRIVWIDSDILINSKYAYDICKDVPLEKVGGVENYSVPTREIYNFSLTRRYRKWDNSGVKYLNNLTPSSYYQNRGLNLNEAELNYVLQTGVFVCSPKYHRQIFEHVYNTYEDTHGAEWNYEMPAISYELVKADLVHWISNRFNFVVPVIMGAFYPELLESNPTKLSLKERIINKLLGKSDSQIKKQKIALQNIYELSIFMHFTAVTHLMGLVDTSNNHKYISEN